MKILQPGHGFEREVFEARVALTNLLCEFLETAWVLRKVVDDAAECSCVIITKKRG